MVRCFFESVMEAFLSPLDDVSANLGCECFSLTIDGGFDSKISIGEVSWIELSICDLKRKSKKNWSRRGIHFTGNISWDVGGTVPYETSLKSVINFFYNYETITKVHNI